MEQEVTSMTRALGQDLKAELAAAFPPAKHQQTNRYDVIDHFGEKFTFHGKEGHYLECGDSVADGAISEGVNGDLDRAQRFHGKVGDIFVVRCPGHCGRYLARSQVYGCGPYLDSSAICMAAILEAKVGYETGGDVAFKLVQPVPHYGSCYRAIKRYIDVQGALQMRASRGRGPLEPAPYKKLWSTHPFDFAEWDRAEGSERLTDGEYEDNKALTLYRTTCSFPYSTTDLNCAGRRAFSLLNVRSGTTDPVISPPSGTYEGPLLVSIDAPKQYIYYTIDGSAPAGDANGPSSPTTIRYRGPFYIDKPGPATVHAMSYSPDFFPSASPAIVADYEVTTPAGGFPDADDLPQVLHQKSPAPLIDAEPQQYIPGTVMIYAPKGVNNVILPDKGPSYQIFFAVGLSPEEIKDQFSYECGGSDRKFESTVKDNGACQVSLPAGVWYIKGKGLLHGQAPCKGCQAYSKSDATNFGPVMVKSRDGDAMPPHFHPHTASFFAHSGLVDIFTVKKMEVLFTLDGAEPEEGEGSSSTVRCGDSLEYNASLITSRYATQRALVSRRSRGRALSYLCQVFAGEHHDSLSMPSTL